MKVSNSEIENPIRGEIFSVERLEEYATFLAIELKISDKPKVSKYLLPRMFENGEILLDSYRTLSEAIHKKEPLTPGAEWLVDNFHIVEDQLREIREDLPLKFYKELPKLSVGELEGFPRIYAIAMVLIAHTDSKLETETMRRFMQTFQKVTPLGMGELWALAITLRITLVENLRRFSLRIVHDRKKRAEANDLADQLLEHVKNPQKFQDLISQIPALCECAGGIECAFVAQLSKRLRDQDPEYLPVVDYLEKFLVNKNSSTELVVQTEHQTQALNQVTVANIITSMRLLSSIDWKDFFESVSLVNDVLKTDPEGSYSKMDFRTRDQYRHVIEKISKKTGHSELSVAKKVIELARDSMQSTPEDKRRAHVGYYLISKGAKQTEKSFGYKIKAKFLTSTITHPSFIYFGLIGALFFLLCAIPFYHSLMHGARLHFLILIGLIILIPVSDLTLSITNTILTNTFRPRILPKKDLSLGIPKEGRTMIVVPCFLSSESVINELLEKLEIYYLGNSDPQLFFAILTDHHDSHQQHLPEDAELLEKAIAGIKDLNLKYGYKDEDRETKNKFFIFHRHRKWNDCENCWMGWERKRGKLQEFNRLLRGADDTSFEIVNASKEFLKSIHYIITLDADTQLPRDSARKLIGTMLHPLNNANFDHKLGRVTEGYGILQPRISISLESSTKSYFSKIFSGHIGIDPYTTAVSDVYQDLFYEGSYTGKGIYNVDAFESALKDRIPENTILSHDLFEGLYARVALLSDIELIDDYPRNYESFFKRQHRWVRGDWQIARWLFPLVPDAKKRLVRNWLPFLARWKIFDNLRRSLVAPATFLWFLMAWTIMPGSTLFWIGSILFIIIFPSLTYVVSGIITANTERNTVPFSTRWAELKTNLFQALLYLSFLPHQSYIQLDAIFRVLYRVFISKSKLMEWSTAAQEEMQESRPLKPFWQTPWPVEFFLIAVTIGLILFYGHTFIMAAPFLLLWMCYPKISSLTARRPERKMVALDLESKIFLRQIARRTWNFFETFVGEPDNFLPPDNYQEDPRPVVAHRTSPTNIGLYGISIIAARDLGFISTAKVISLLQSTLHSMNKLERFKGHFYNWYDTETLQPLHPKYISTVDSGNLAGYFLVIKQACLEVPNNQVIEKSFLEGLRDMLSITETELRIFNKDHVISEIENCRKILSSLSFDQFSHWVVMIKSLSKAMTELRSMIQTNYKSEELLKWIDSNLKQLHDFQEELSIYAPWTREQFSGILSAEWGQLVREMDNNTTFADLSASYELLLKKIDITKDISPDFLAALKKGKKAIDNLLKGSEDMARLLNQIFEEMNFAFLLDNERRVFTIGYNVSDSVYDNAYYDLLASEARLGSFVAIAKGDVPQEHWFRLGRQLVPVIGGRALISWSASMFEYLMPLLVMRDYENTLLDETVHSVVSRQISYGKEHKIPWGISEAGCNARDLQLNYQYGPFGIPGLGLKRGLSHDLVVSPYSTLLASMVNPMAAILNLKTMAKKELLTLFGFYEAIDYTADRHTEKQKYAVVKSFMAHHQGMSLIAINNVLNNRIMQDRFHNEPCVRATRLLLQERIPRGVLTVMPKAAAVELEGEHRATINTFIRQYTDPNITTPRTQLLSNGNYSVMISTAGSGFSKYQERAVTRWREDAVQDKWGNYIFIKDCSNKKVWSTSFQPTTNMVPESYKVTFAEDKVEFFRRDNDIVTRTEILVAPDDNVEIRHVAITNNSNEPKILELTSYLEPVLAPFSSDSDHPAFSKLFIQTEFLSLKNALFAKRRNRSSTEKEVYGLHVVVSDCKFLSEVQYETDRTKFIGRGRSILNPMVFEDDRNLTNTTGPTLDPILSLRVKIRLAAGETGHVTFSTGFASSYEEAINLSDRFHDINAFDRESKLAWTKSQVDLRHLNIDSEAVYLFQRLAERIFYFDPSLKPAAHKLTVSTNIYSCLWPYGISGDFPIVTVFINGHKDAAFVRKLLRCHEYLRLNGLLFDLVILNGNGVTYIQELQETLQMQIRTTGSLGWLNKRGGIFILRADVSPKEHFDTIQAVARVSLFADQPFKDQIDRRIPKEKYPPLLTPRSEPQKHGILDLPVPKLDFYNEYGGFNKETGEYVIALNKDQWTPAPWINVIGNGSEFGFQISETGSGFTWSINSQENRLTPWSNDPITDQPGEIIYLRDEETGEIWCPTPLPIRDDSNYIVKHGQGYSTFEHIGHGFQHTLTVFVPKEDTIKISTLKLNNISNKKRKISVTSYTEWVLGSQRQKSGPNLICDIDQETGAIFVQNPYGNEFAKRVAFADISESNRTYTCSRKEFLGRNGNYLSPAALKRTGLNRKKGTGEDPCAVLQTTFEFKPYEQQEIVILLGQCESAEKARELTLRYRNRDAVEKAFLNVTEQWNSLINSIQIKTPNPAMDILMNHWLLYQILSCRFWSRTAFYQSGGAFGFRDQLQDCMAFVYSAPHLTRAHILRSARHQFKEGDVQHWWHPPTPRGIRTRMTDDLLWLPYVVSFYINLTGDSSILTESVPFLDAPVLLPEQEDSYSTSELSAESSTIFEHCLRAIDCSLTLGDHGLPLIGTGDWNDGMNRVGVHGEGESVWLGWFLYKVINDFLPFCENSDQKERVNLYKTHMEKLKAALNNQGWDGEWYRRAYYDDGSPLGSAANEECKIDCIAQTWSVLSGAGEPTKTELAMRKVEEFLVLKESQIILLLTPPFDKTQMDPGYIKGYIPGVRENGGQYTHAAAWTIFAEAEMGNGDKAFELFNMLNPINHALDKTDADKYKIEPYVLAGDVYGGNVHKGRGGWSWYTGSASWFYRAGLESILGFQLRGSNLKFKPCIPKTWSEYEITYIRGKTTYNIKIENPHGLNHGKTIVKLDGAIAPGAELNLVDDAKIHSVAVTLEYQ